MTIKIADKEIEITLDEVRQWPAVVSAWPRAGRAVGLTRSHTYALIARGEFPCRVIQAGNRYLVPTADLIALLEHRPAEAS